MKDVYKIYLDYKNYFSKLKEAVEKSQEYKDALEEDKSKFLEFRANSVLEKYEIVTYIGLSVTYRDTVTDALNWDIIGRPQIILENIK